MQPGIYITKSIRGKRVKDRRELFPISLSNKKALQID
jgi:hypothetical protein